MNATCRDRERIFLDGTAEEWAALELHAASCGECVEELRAWKSLSEASEELRDYREDPTLWAKIETSLKERERSRAGGWRLRDRSEPWREISLGWQSALAGALVLVLAVCGVYLYVYQTPPQIDQRKLLKNSALAEVERSEREYVKAIDKLAVAARPQLDSPSSPLMASYREKLMVLDSAIDDLRGQAGQNPSNAHLRNQLLAMYQEKQQTLQDVLESKP
jgi:hypothetical protein